MNERGSHDPLNGALVGTLATIAAACVLVFIDWPVLVKVTVQAGVFLLFFAGAVWPLRQYWPNSVDERNGLRNLILMLSLAGMAVLACIVPSEINPIPERADSEVPGTKEDLNEQNEIALDEARKSSDELSKKLEYLLQKLNRLEGADESDRIKEQKEMLDELRNIKLTDLPEGANPLNKINQSLRQQRYEIEKEIAKIVSELEPINTQLDQMMKSSKGS